MTSDEDDPMLGALVRFPAVLHARASLLFDVKLETLQRLIVHALLEIKNTVRSIEVSIADHDGYTAGTVNFRVGVGNELGFNSLDGKLVERLLRRIEKRGPLQTLDMAFHLGYAIKDGGRHNVRGDSYIVRMQFRPGAAELLLHHLKGLRRIQPDEVLRTLVSVVNSELVKEHYAEVELESLTST